MASVSKNWNPELSALEQQLLAQDNADRGYTDSEVAQARSYTDSKISQIRPENKSAGSVGSYGFLYPVDINQSEIHHGDTRAGSAFYFGGVNGGAGFVGKASKPSGTWRCMGYASRPSGQGIIAATVFLRIA